MTRGETPRKTLKPLSLIGVKLGFRPCILDVPVINGMLFPIENRFVPKLKNKE